MKVTVVRSCVVMGPSAFRLFKICVASKVLQIVFGEMACVLHRQMDGAEGGVCRKIILIDRTWLDKDLGLG